MCNSVNRHEIQLGPRVAGKDTCQLGDSPANDTLFETATSSGQSLMCTTKGIDWGVDDLEIAVVTSGLRVTNNNGWNVPSRSRP